MIDRPTVVEDSHLTYLDDLRESGVTNMFGAGAYLMSTFGGEINLRESRTILTYWMESFGERHPG